VCGAHVFVLHVLAQWTTTRLSRLHTPGSFDSRAGATRGIRRTGAGVRHIHVPLPCHFGALQDITVVRAVLVHVKRTWGHPLAVAQRSPARLCICVRTGGPSSVAAGGWRAVAGCSSAPGALERFVGMHADGRFCCLRTTERIASAGVARQHIRRFAGVPCVHWRSRLLLRLLT
jgi:hypothetical protein